MPWFQTTVLQNSELAAPVGSKHTSTFHDREKHPCAVNTQGVKTPNSGEQLPLRGGCTSGRHRVPNTLETQHLFSWVGQWAQGVSALMSLCTS